ncbi:hypothetical protein [Vreelandella olivaria]|uniref:hypothetical protein n=1 Tax=Vreelandella olivaria TaxID=390919 RepID=UPI00201F91E9|nr:hypothetical protein [Halomonas olivaria]
MTDFNGIPGSGQFDVCRFERPKKDEYTPSFKPDEGADTSLIKPKYTYLMTAPVYENDEYLGIGKGTAQFTGIIEDDGSWQMFPQGELEISHH